MKKGVILGSTGMLGHVLNNYLDLNSKYNLFNVSFRKNLNSKTKILDVSNIDRLEKYIREVKPDFVVNCIGVLVKGSNQNIKNAIQINAFFPHLLIELCNELNCKLIHISTDCVFSGKRGNYNENSIKDAIDIYGKTKSLGEFDLEKHLCIRTSIIGPELKENGEGLLHWLLNQRGEIFGFKNVFWSGVTTLELSKAIEFSIESDVSGLWNLTNEIGITKYDLLKKIINCFDLKDIDLKPSTDKVSNKTLRTIRKINYVVKNYDQMINELKNYIELNRSSYNYKF